MKVPGNAAGKTFKCVKCGNHIQVGAAGLPPSPQAAPAEAPAALEPIGQILVESGCITPLQLDEALGVQRRDGGKTFEILLKLGYLDKARLHEALSKQPGVAAIDLARVTIDREVAKLVPRETALQQLVLPIDRLGKLLTVAMACPLDVATISSIEKETGLKVKAMLCRYDDIQAAVQKNYREGADGQPEMHTFQLPPGFDAAPKDEISEKLSRMEELQYRNDVLDRLNELLREPASSVGLILRTIFADPAVGAAVLRTANSAAYGMAGQVDSLSLAVALLGREGLSGLVARCKKANVAPPPNLVPLYERAGTTAMNAAVLARATGRTGHELALTAGLLCGLGSFAIGAASAQRYAKVKTDADIADLAKEEKQLFNVNHADAGSVLLKRWRLPESLHAAIGVYLAPPDPAQKHAALAGVLRAAASGTLEQAAEAIGAKPDAIARGRREEDKQWESLNTTRF